LFGVPEIGLDDYDLSGAVIREFTTDLCQRVGAVADVVEKLQDGGWAGQVLGNCLEVGHRQVNTYAKAVYRQSRLQIDEQAITDIAEWNNVG
jgi:hypothetical protein